MNIIYECFNRDILYNIINYLDKDTTFHLLHTCHEFYKYSDLMTIKYIFHYNVTRNKPIFKHVKHLLLRDYNFDKNDFPKLPPELQSLNIYCNSFNQKINSLPTSLQHICIRSSTFNQKLDEWIRLPKLTSLQIRGGSFNEPLDQLPQSLITLDFPWTYSFNQPVDQLPINLKTLNIQGLCFNQPMDKLPNTLEKLTIRSNSFNHPINKCPQNLKELTIISNTFNKPLHFLPNLNALCVICHDLESYNISDYSKIKKVFIKTKEIKYETKIILMMSK